MAVHAIKNVGDCRRWLAQHPPQDAPLLPVAELAQLLVRVADGEFSTTVGYRILELLRQRIVADARILFDQVRAAPAPHFNRFFGDLRKADQCLEALTCSYRALHGQIEAQPRPRLSFIPGSSNSLKQTMPLLRALELQSNRIGGRLLCRVVIDDDLWEELASLGRQVRDTTFLDEEFPLDYGTTERVTARALITFPVLLHIAGYAERTRAQATWIEYFARRHAARTGFRLDPFRGSGSNPYGPSMRMGRQYLVRLDTHRLLASLARHDNEIESDLLHMQACGLSISGLTVSRLHELNNDLRIRWSAAWRWPNMQQVNYPGTRLAFGLPDVIHAADGKTYEYGRYHQPETVTALQRGPSAALGSFSTSTEDARVTGIDHERVVLERYADKPAPAINTLVALDMIAPAQAGTTRLRLGRVQRVEHIMSSESGRASQRLAIQTLRGEPQPVRLCGHRDKQAYLLGSEYGTRREASVFVSPDLVRPGSQVRFELASGDVSVQVGRLLERGPDFDHYHVTACGASVI